MKHPFRRPGLAEVLVTQGSLSDVQLAQVGGADTPDLGERLLSAGLIDASRLQQAMAEVVGLPFIALGDFAISAELFARFPATVAYQMRVVPWRDDGHTLHVATADPHDPAQADRLQRLIGQPVRLVLSTAADIHAVLERSQGAGEVLRDLSEDMRLVVVREGGDGQEHAVGIDALDDSAGPVVKLVHTLLLDGLAKRASDIHIESYDRGVLTKYRIDGVLYPATQPLDPRYHSALVSRLKVMADLDIAEKRVPQDGRFKLRQGRREIDFRISVLPSAFGEDVVIRILDKSALTEGLRDLSLEGLGIAPELLRRFRRSIHEPYGMVLITGPTGSGKTTTLYSALTELNAGEEKIITIEDPIEYQLEGVVQVAVNEKKGLTFARGLRSILRHDPDKIMVGEIRDLETAQIAVQSALTGHLVFTTVHANNAYDVISRFGHMGVDIHAFVAALNCVMAQRLVRTICPRCRQACQVDDDLLERSGIDPADRGEGWWEGRGCEHCNGTGYRGREAITEFVALSPRLRKLILDRVPADEFQAAAIAEGMVTLRRSALEKARAGATTLREINRVTFID